MRITKPKYSIGSKVFHITAKKWGKIIGSFQADDGSHRYYINHSGYTWSVPESYLMTSKRGIKTSVSPREMQ